jgi:ribosomal protein S18 acetylase RimI-like enzyme
MTPETRVRALRAEETAAASALAAEAFRENRFYQAALGLDPAAFDSYWEVFLPLALADRGARVWAVEDERGLIGLLVVSIGRFPAPLRGLAFLRALLRRIGPRRLVRYLRFVADYDAVMRRPRAERRIEARGLWLLVSPRARRPGLGAVLVRGAIERSAAEGRTLCTGLMDAGNRRLIDFYRRAGFRVGASFAFGKGMAATIELRAGGEGAP